MVRDAASTPSMEAEDLDGLDVEIVEEPPRLEEGYYLDNFLAVLDTVETHDHDLLNDVELAFGADFRALDVAAQRLYVRLISRRGPHFRRDRLAYVEIPDLDPALDNLKRVGFLDGADDAAAEELMPLLLRGELFDLAVDLLPEPPARSRRKGELCEMLRRQVAAEPLIDAIRRRVNVLRPLRHEVLAVFRLLYFGNLYQDWTEFVLRDLGVVRFEPYVLRRELRRFDCRQAIDDSLTIRRMLHEAHTHLAADELDEAVALAQQVVAAEADWHPMTRRRRQNLLLTVARQLERREALDDALRLYDHVTIPPARERRARVLERQQRLDEALAVCREMAAAPRDESENVFASRFAHRLRRSQGEELAPWRRPRRPRRQMSWPRHPELSVERQALAALGEEGLDGFFAENWLWKSLFGLAFWDILFAPVAGAFQHAFQYGPLDQHSADFRPRRHELIEHRLAELRRSTDLRPRVLDVYRRKQGTANRWVTWHPELLRRLDLALGQLDGPRLATVCDRLSRHPGRFRRGLPDLFVWRPGTPGFTLYEVKAPGDQIRPEQGAWIDYLNSHDIDARILRVTWAADAPAP